MPPCAHQELQEAILGEAERMVTLMPADAAVSAAEQPPTPAPTTSRRFESFTSDGGVIGDNGMAEVVVVMGERLGRDKLEKVATEGRGEGVAARKKEFGWARLRERAPRAAFMSAR